MVALSSNAKTLALASPGVRALSREEYFNKAAVVQELASEAGLPDSPEGHALMDYAFAGLLWSEGLLLPVPVEVAVPQSGEWVDVTDEVVDRG